MKLSENYMLSSVAEQVVAIPIGQNVANQSSILKFNETSAFILKCLENEMSIEKLRETLFKKYEPIGEEKNALCLDLAEFIETAKTIGLIVD